MAIITGGTIIGYPTLTGGVIEAGVGLDRVFHIAAAPVNGTSGTLAGVAPPGTVLMRDDTTAIYQNTGTQASPTWTARV